MRPPESFSQPNSLKRQVVCFGVVGAHAAIVNFGALMIFVAFVGLTPLVANIVAFLVAYQVSFWGHRCWTFRGPHAHHHLGLRFFGVALLSLGLNEGIFAVFLLACHLYYPISMILTLLIVPPITFVLSRVWAFS